MKKQFKLVFSFMLLFTLVLAACGGSVDNTATDTGDDAASGEVIPAEEIVFYNWTEYIEPEIYTLFEAATGIRVIEDNFSSNEEMLAKLQGGADGYAIVVPSDYTVTIMVEEGMLHELDHSNLPNLANLGDRFQNPSYDPGNAHCIPYQWGTTGLAYIDGQVEEPTSWSVLFDPSTDHPAYGRTTMLDDVRESFAAALIYLGYNVNSMNEAELEEAKQVLIQAKAGLSGYDSDNFGDLLSAEENLMVHGWNGDVLFAQEDNENIAYTIPEEGAVGWVDTACIPITASPEQKLAAEMFLNFLLDAEIGAMLSEYNWYASPNAAAEALLDEEFLTDTTVYPTAEVMAKLQYIEPLGEFEAVYQRMWDEVKSAP